MKRAGGIAQVIEHLPSKYKALTSNPSTSRTKQNKNKNDNNNYNNNKPNKLTNKQETKYYTQRRRWDL
jgi:hypothetical protein